MEKTLTTKKVARKVLHKPYRVAVKVAKKITAFDQVLLENEQLKLDNNELAKRLTLLEKDYHFGHPKGHYYSPVHSLEDIRNYEKVRNKSKENFFVTMPGFSENRMIKELNEIKCYFREFDYPKNDDGKCRFYSDNVSLSLLDSLVIFSMIRKNKPKKIIEIGSGFSSGLMMEINEKYFDNKIDITFIEPYPELLKQRMSKGDESKYKIISKGVQNVSLDVFKQLKKDDILFIDSTHVSKFNSDVNYELFNILPELNEGVIIHFHDICDGFEYPKIWLEMGWSWNEAYLLRAFLIGNRDYDILLMTDYLANHHKEILQQSYSNKVGFHGGSLWVRKTQKAEIMAKS